MKYSQYNHKNVGVYLLYGIMILFVAIGVIYNPYYLAETFSSVGVLPNKFYIASWITSSLLISLGIGLFLFRKYITSRINEFLLLAISITFTFLIMEGGVRIYLYNFSPEKQSHYLASSSVKLMPKYSPHHYMGYMPTPNYTSLDNLTSHNELGYRNDPIKSKNGFRIVTVGGSTTYTENVKDNKKTYPYLLQEKLLSKVKNSKLEVINAGVGGFDSFQT